MKQKKSQTLIITGVMLTLVGQVAASEFTSPEWAADENATHSEWLNFTSAVGAPGNHPDIEGSSAGGLLSQSVPGAVVTGSGNIYNPATRSAFSLENEATVAYRTVRLQTRIIGGIDTGNVVLEYETDGAIQSLANSGKEVSREEGAFGDTVVNQWTWDLEGQDVTSFTIRFGATAPHASLAAVRLDLLNEASPKPLVFEIPSWSSDDHAAYSEWLSFTTALGDPGNGPDVEGSNAGGILTQSVPGAIVTGSMNIYNPAAPSEFTLTGSSDDNFETIVFQTRLIGSVDPESVALDYEKDGVTFSLTAPTVEVAFEAGAFGNTVINQWTWDVTQFDIKAFSIRFNATGAHASLAAARLDTLTQAPRSPLVFQVPAWSTANNAQYSEWLSFTSAFGPPGNSPDVEGSNAGGVLSQSVPGAVVTGSMNIYNPAGPSAFSISDDAITPYRNVVLQTKIIGGIDPESVVLEYHQGGITLGVVAVVEELVRQSGGFGDTVVNRYSWDLTGQNISGLSIGFNATGAHASLVSARLDTLQEPELTGELVEANLDSPSQDRWNYPFNATPGTRARASLFQAGDPEVGVDRHGTYIIGFDTTNIVPTGHPPVAYQIVSAQLRVLTSDNFEVAYDPTYDPVATHLPQTNDSHIADQDAGRPIHVFATGFRHGFDSTSWEETCPSAPKGSFERSVFPAIRGADGESVDVTLAVDFADPVDIVPFATGMLSEIASGELIPHNTWMTFDVDLTEASTIAYLQEGLAGGNLYFTLTSLNSGGREVRSFPEFHTKDSLLGEAPQLSLRVQIVDAPVSLDPPSITGIQATDAGMTLRFEQSASGTYGIRWTHDFITWNNVDNPTIETLADGNAQWTDSEQEANQRFYQVTLNP